MSNAADTFKHGLNAGRISHLLPLEQKHRARLDMKRILSTLFPLLTATALMGYTLHGSACDRSSKSHTTARPPEGGGRPTGRPSTGPVGPAGPSGRPVAPSVARLTGRSSAPPPSAPSTPGKWNCAADGDCMNSCRLGAINRTWYKANLKNIVECMDGCNNQISGPPRCVKGGCVAFDNKGKKRVYCTRKAARP